MALRVLEPGPFTLVVDFGRPRSRALGVPLGGAADRAALALGNALVGNAPDAPALEMALCGPTLLAEVPVAAVAFGASFALSVNGAPRAAGTTFALEPGDVLKVGGTPTGARAYLCVAGGLEAPVVLGSRSALEPVRAGAVLGCRPSRVGGRSLPFAAFPDGRHMPMSPGGEWVFRLLPGPQRDWFADSVLTGTGYEVTAASDRMGLRLRGMALERRPGELVSEAVAPGAVQVANDGQPIVLGVDGQTIGGYPKVAHVVRADLDRLAQLRPGARFWSTWTTIEEAEAAARSRALALRAWVARAAAAEGAPTFLDAPSAGPLS